jgi:putative DNA primase/helicase
LTIIGNYRPVLRNVDGAIRRRFIVVPFRTKPAKPDRFLEDRLRREWPAILRWMINGAVIWQREGLVAPRSIAEETAEYLSSQDVLGHWIAEACDFEPGNEWKAASVGALYASWADFNQRTGEPAPSKKAFSAALEKQGLLSYRTNTERGFKGIRLKPLVTDDRL